MECFWPERFKLFSETQEDHIVFNNQLSMISDDNKGELTAIAPEQNIDIICFQEHCKYHDDVNIKHQEHRKYLDDVNTIIQNMDG